MVEGRTPRVEREKALVSSTAGNVPILRAAGKPPVRNGAFPAAEPLHPSITSAIVPRRVVHNFPRFTLASAAGSTKPAGPADNRYAAISRTAPAGAGERQIQGRPHRHGHL